VSHLLVVVLRTTRILVGVVLLLALTLILVNLQPALGRGDILITQVDAGSGSVSAAPPGTPCPAPGCGEAIGVTVTVTATPDPGWQFSSWSTQTGASCIGGPTVNPCQVVMPVGEVTVTIGATFIQVLTGVDAGSGSVDPNCPAPTGCSETPGVTVTVTATPSSGWQFSSWSTQTGASCIGGPTVNPCVFAMPANNVVLGATFIQFPAVHATPVGGVMLPSVGLTVLLPWALLLSLLGFVSVEAFRVKRRAKQR
jgi:hypothetical protein